ncbi:MAG: ABC transporter ATP-binding protein [Pseudomonadota bacterium]
MILSVDLLCAGYKDLAVLRDVSFDVKQGEVHCLLGRNGAGKSTAMKAIMGLIPVTSGRVLLNSNDLVDTPASLRGKQGLGYVPQGRRLFADLTVAENLEIGLLTRPSPRSARDAALDLFPRLRERLAQRAATLSGGEQQMLAIARALCTEPDVLLMDEPTEGLQPSMIDAIRVVIRRLRDSGTAIVLIEQRLETVLRLADRVTFLENGRTRETVSVSDLKGKPDLTKQYLGV